MCLLLSSSLVLFLWNLCLAIAVNHDQQQVENLLVSHERFDQCKSVGNFCETNNDCCSSLICYAIQGLNLCLPSTIDSQFKRQTDDLIIPPYYNPSQQLYPYGISQPGLPFYKGHESKQSSEGKKLEWDHCHFHEDCGEGNCCYVHFRFRSLPKWFCRPNRSDARDLCEPLAKYRSLKDVPAWKQQQQKQKTAAENPSEQR